MLSRLFRRRVQLCQKISDKAENTWRPSSQLHIFSRQAQSSATLSLLFRKRVQLCQKEPHTHYYVSFRKQRGVIQKSKGRLLRNRRGVVLISKRHLSTRVKEQYHHLILYLYMSTFVFYGKANLKKMPNSPSPLRAHSQQSLSKYSILSSSPKMIPDAWSTDDPGGNGGLKYADSFTASSKQRYLISSRSKAKVSHIMLFPFLFLCPCSYSHGKVKKQSAGTWSQSSVLEPTAWNLFLIAYLALLSSSHLQRLIHFQRRDHSCTD